MAPPPPQHHFRDPPPFAGQARKWVLDILLKRLESDAQSAAVGVRVIDHFQYAVFCLFVLMCFSDKLEESKIKEIDEIPPAQMASRYGNISYRVWQERLVENSETLMLRFLPDELRSSTVEIIPYFTDSFGNSSRIDYGTGHETNFAAWLYCLARLEVIREEDYQAAVVRIFVKYMALMRKL
ncbi:uncharacterized protein LOC133815679 [Humulus lupulus]|uniref:uncharacterized protein LOC133815679 n=1 Tax=Humulus lupulus TaxID=3486 RepID=UPI002B4063C6|nr:uncharacterized protein LOC133815679 [Humulus lupulus]